MSNKITELDVAQIPITNSGADARFGDLIFEDGFLGTVADFNDLTAADTKGIVTGAVGNIDISADRIISTQQIAATQTFVVQTLCYFHGANREITDSLDLGTVVCGYITEVMDNTHIKIKLLPQSGALVVA